MIAADRRLAQRAVGDNEESPGLRGYVKYFA